jgi:hypothetical protein
MPAGYWAEKSVPCSVFTEDGLRGLFGLLVGSVLLLPKSFGPSLEDCPWLKYRHAEVADVTGEATQPVSLASSGPEPHVGGSSGMPT